MIRSHVTHHWELTFQNCIRIKIGFSRYSVGVHHQSQCVAFQMDASTDAVTRHA